MTAFDDELAELETDVKRKRQSIADAELHLKKVDHELAQQIKEQSNAKGVIESLEAQFPWIQDESK